MKDSAFNMKSVRSYSPDGKIVENLLFHFRKLCTFIYPIIYGFPLTKKDDLMGSYRRF